MLKNQMNPQALLSTLWIFILLNMILRDLHEFPTEGSDGTPAKDTE